MARTDRATRAIKMEIWAITAMERVFFPFLNATNGNFFPFY
jgi:hypothetical protein